MRILSFQNFKNFLNLTTVKLLTIENIKKAPNNGFNEEYHVNFVLQNENFIEDFLLTNYKNT